MSVQREAAGAAAGGGGAPDEQREPAAAARVPPARQGKACYHLFIFSTIVHVGSACRFAYSLQQLPEYHWRVKCAFSLDVCCILAVMQRLPERHLCNQQMAASSLKATISSICLSILQVLQRMGYLNRDQSVTMKGRVACEVNSGARAAPPRPSKLISLKHLGAGRPLVAAACHRTFTHIVCDANTLQAASWLPRSSSSAKCCDAWGDTLHTMHLLSSESICNPFNRPCRRRAGGHGADLWRSAGGPRARGGCCAAVRARLPGKLVGFVSLSRQQC